MPTSVFFFGGRYRKDGWRPSDVVAQYANHLWSELGKLAEPRNSHRSFEINGKILIFGGSLRYKLCINKQYEQIFVETLKFGNSKMMIPTLTM